MLTAIGVAFAVLRTTVNWLGWLTSSFFRCGRKISPALLERLGTDPSDMVERLIAYDGTTAQGLRTMLDEGIDQAVHRGLEAAHRVANGTGKAPS